MMNLRKYIREVLNESFGNNIKPGIDFVYKQHSELNNIGTQEQYAQYLNTIFPNSKVKEIVYHSTNAKEIEGGKLRPSREGVYGEGIYVQTKREFGSDFGSNTLSIVIDTKKPFSYNKENGQRNDLFSGILEKWRNTKKYYFAEAAKEEFRDVIISQGYDSIKTDEPGDNSYYILFEPEQVHVLGSEQDVEGFKKFVGKVLSESSIGERYILLPYSDDNEHFEEYGIDEYEAYEQAHEVAKNGGVTILRDKRLSEILIDTVDSKVIGAIWVSDDSDKFSFDIAIDSGYQNMGLSSKLIKSAISEYEMQKEAYGDDFKMEVDVINPKLAQILQSKYGFHKVADLGPTRVLMSTD